MITPKLDVPTTHHKFGDSILEVSDCAVPIKLIHSYNRAMYKIHVQGEVFYLACKAGIVLSPSN